MSAPVAARRRHYDPWEDAAARGVDVREERLPGQILGVTEFPVGRPDLMPRVILDRDLLGRAKAATLAHELAHLDVEHAAPGRFGNGTEGHPCASVEDECDRIAAERLIDFDALLEAAKWADSIEEMAEELHVDHALVLARIGALDGRQAGQLERAAGQMKRYAGAGAGWGSTLKRSKPLQRRKPLGVHKTLQEVETWHD